MKSVTIGQRSQQLDQSLPSASLCCLGVYSLLFAISLSYALVVLVRPVTAVHVSVTEILRRDALLEPVVHAVHRSCVVGHLRAIDYSATHLIGAIITL